MNSGFFWEKSDAMILIVRYVVFSTGFFEAAQHNRSAMSWLLAV
jgi:hypothetical protein